MCIKSGELELALDVYSQMRAEGVTPNLVTFNTLIDVYGKTGQWEEAVRVLDTLEQQVREHTRFQSSFGKHRSMVASLLQVASAYAGHHAEMLLRDSTVVDEEALESRLADVIQSSLAALACISIKQSQPSSSRTVFYFVQGIEPEVRTFNTVIIACNMSGQAAEALKVYERMLNVGAQPTATTYTALIRCAVRASHMTSDATGHRRRSARASALDGLYLLDMLRC